MGQDCSQNSDSIRRHSIVADISVGGSHLRVEPGLGVDCGMGQDFLEELGHGESFLLGLRPVPGFGSFTSSKLP